MDLKIEGRTALVFGAGGGLGSAIGRQLLDEGANVVFADIDQEALQRVCAGLDDAGRRALPLQWDLGELGIIGERLQAIAARFGTVDILVNNTGGPPPTPVSGQAPELWARKFHEMVLSVIAITDSVLPGMVGQGWGRIITSASSGVIAPIPNLGLSNALRMTLVGWSKTLAREVGRHGVTANIVVPGRIATPRIAYLDQQKAAREKRRVEDVAAESTAGIPVGRYGLPEEYADAVAFLASRRAAFITGSVLRMDGGMINSI